MADYEGTDGADRYRGTDGYDTIAGYDGDDRLWGEGGPDTIYGGNGDDILRGGDGDDRLSGGPGRDQAFGGGGNDIFEGITEHNRIYGGAGDDEVWFVSGGNRVAGTAEGGAGSDTVRFQGATFTARTGTVDLTGFEHLSAGATLYARFGEDCVIDLSSLSAPSFASETLQIFAAGGANRIVVTGGAERDEIMGGAGDDILDGGAGDDTMSGAIGVDTLVGGDGADTLQIVVYEPMGAVVSLADGFCRTGEEVDSISEFENVVATGLGDRVRGDAGANRLDGGYGDDRLAGGGGNDVVIGSFGKDALSGGRGADIFDVNARDDGAVVGDTVLDFSHGQGDRIDLSTLDADWTQDGVQHFTFVGEAAFSGRAGELRVVAADGAVLLSADLNGDAETDYAVRLDGVTTLTAADLILAPAAAPVHEGSMHLSSFALGAHMQLA